MPPIISRAMWGADESRRSGKTKYSGTIKAAFIHHTVSTNNYTPEEAAKQVRNLYQWFTRGLRYNDMAYNFLIDRYGRLYEGRGGGMDRAVIGGHTAGFNDDTFAVSAIGDFRTFRPSPTDQAAINESLASLLAWKLSMSQRDPNGTTILTSDSRRGHLALRTRPAGGRPGHRRPRRHRQHVVPGRRPRRSRSRRSARWSPRRWA